MPKGEDDLNEAVATLLRYKKNNPSAFNQAMEILVSTPEHVLAAAPTARPLATSLEKTNNPKGALQTFTQQNDLPMPIYEIDKPPSGPDHAPLHHQRCKVTLRNGTILTAEGSDRARRKAEQLAATQMLAKLKELADEFARAPPAPRSKVAAKSPAKAPPTALMLPDLKLEVDELGMIYKKENSSNISTPQNELRRPAKRQHSAGGSPSSVPPVSAVPLKAECMDTDSIRRLCFD